MFEPDLGAQLWQACHPGKGNTGYLGWVEGFYLRKDGVLVNLWLLVSLLEEGISSSYLLWMVALSRLYLCLHTHSSDVDLFL